MKIFPFNNEAAKKNTKTWNRVDHTKFSDRLNLVVSLK